YRRKKSGGPKGRSGFFTETPAGNKSGQNAQMTRAASSRRTTVQDLSREIGRPSAISTRSPSLYWLVSSCALYRLERTMILPRTGCLTRRSTFTTTVLSILLLTTRPIRVRWRLAGAVVWVSLILLSCLLSHDGTDDRYVTAFFAKLDGVGMLLSIPMHK